VAVVFVRDEAVAYAYRTLIFAPASLSTPFASAPDSRPTYAMTASSPQRDEKRDPEANCNARHDDEMSRRHVRARIMIVPGHKS